MCRYSKIYEYSSMRVFGVYVHCYVDFNIVNTYRLAHPCSLTKHHFIGWPTSMSNLNIPNFSYWKWTVLVMAGRHVHLRFFYFKYFLRIRYRPFWNRWSKLTYYKSVLRKHWADSSKKKTNKKPTTTTTTKKQQLWCQWPSAKVVHTTIVHFELKSIV